MEKLQDRFEDPCKIIILGSRYSGKQQLLNILVEEYHFQKLQLPPLSYETSTSSSRPSSPSSPRRNFKKIDLSKNNGIPDLCTENYKDHGVYIMSEPNHKILEKLKNRNFINVVAIDSPFKIRYLHALKELPLLTIQQFAQLDLQSQSEEYEKCLDYVKVTVKNRGTLGHLREEIKKKCHSIIKPFRPDWDQYFMKIADIARRRSNCMKTAVGCVLVNSNNRVVSTGYNGTPRGLQSCFKDGCSRCNNNQNKALDECLCLHAEQSAIIEVGITQTVGCRLYTTLYPCFSCAKVLKQAGIAKIYYKQPYAKKDNGEKFLRDNYEYDKDVKQIIIDDVFY